MGGRSAASAGAVPPVVCRHVGQDLLGDLRCAIATVHQPRVEAAVVDGAAGNRRRSKSGSGRIGLYCCDKMLSVHGRNMDFCPLYVNGLLSSGSDLLRALR